LGESSEVLENFKSVGGMTRVIRPNQDGKALTIFTTGAHQNTCLHLHLPMVQRADIDYSCKRSSCECDCTSWDFRAAGLDSTCANSARPCMDMKKLIPISDRDALQLPLHDAVFITIVIESAEDGFLTASVSVKINSEEVVQPLRELGITGFDLSLVFERCWQIRSNFLGYATVPESICKFEIEEDSDLKEKMLASGLGDRRMVHFRIEGSQGSQLDVLARNVSVIDESGNVPGTGQRDR
jgi:hypothetical protein